MKTRYFDKNKKVKTVLGSGQKSIKTYQGPSPRVNSFLSIKSKQKLIQRQKKIKKKLKKTKKIIYIYFF